MRNLAALICGCVVCILGGLIGLGGAEFRLPLLVGLCRYRILQAIVINLIVSLATVTFSFVFRARHVPVEQVAVHWPSSSTSWQAPCWVRTRASGSRPGSKK